MHASPQYADASTNTAADRPISKTDPDGQPKNTTADQIASGANFTDINSSSEHADADANLAADPRESNTDFIVASEAITKTATDHTVLDTGFPDLHASPVEHADADANLADPRDSNTVVSEAFTTTATDHTVLDAGFTDMHALSVEQAIADANLVADPRESNPDDFIIPLDLSEPFTRTSTDQTIPGVNSTDTHTSQAADHEVQKDENHHDGSWTKRMLKCLPSCGTKKRKVSSSSSDDSGTDSTSDPPSSGEEDSNNHQRMTAAPTHTSCSNGSQKLKTEEELPQTVEELTASIIRPLTKLNCDLAVANIQAVTSEYYTRCFESNHLHNLLGDLEFLCQMKMELKRELKNEFTDFPAYYRLKSHLEVSRRVQRSFQAVHARVVEEAQVVLAVKFYLQSVLEMIPRISRLDEDSVADVCSALETLYEKMDVLSELMRENRSKYELFFVCRRKVMASFNAV